MESTRQSRVGKLIQKDLSEIMLTLSKGLAPGKMITITRVRVTADLGLAKSYVSIFPTDENKKIIDNLNRHLPQIRFELGNRIRHQLKKIPELHFYLDDSLDYIENIDNLLKE